MRATTWWVTLALMTCGCSGSGGAGEPKDTAVPEQHTAPVDKGAPPVATEAPPGEKPPGPDATTGTAEDEHAKRIVPPADLAAPPKDAEKTRSGASMLVVRPGTGTEKPSGDDSVWLHYTAWDTAGNVVDSTFKRKFPRNTRVKKLTEGWQQVIEAMVEGEIRRTWLPERLAYTKSDRQKGRSGTLVIDFELLKLAKAPRAPEDVAKPPKDALLTVSGLAYKVLTSGKGDERPGPTSEVSVRYSGWTTDGECFDFTPPEESTSFKLDGVIKGWTEGLQLMSPGQKNRFWIPEDLAYAGKEGKPKGMLVFDVELLDISP